VRAVDYSVDRAGMRTILRQSPTQLEQAIHMVDGLDVPGQVERVVICGMGGSALAGDIVAAAFPHSRKPICVSRNYALPPGVDRHTWVFACSFSGNTEETLSSFEMAIRLEAKVTGITTGGTLLESCRANGVPVAIMGVDAKRMQPRCCTGLFFGAIALLLGQAGIIDFSAKDSLALRDFLLGLDLEEEGRRLAQSFSGFVPVVYASERYGAPVARILKIKLNENAKIPAFYDVLPELSHNDMMGFSQGSKLFKFLVLRDPSDHPRMLKRMDVLTEIYHEMGLQVETFHMLGRSFLEKVFSSLLLGDWLSYYTALLHHRDPTPVELVSEFKRRMTTP